MNMATLLAVVGDSFGGPLRHQKSDMGILNTNWRATTGLPLVSQVAFYFWMNG